MPTILVTGGAGYIGSHVCKALKTAGYEPVTFDNLSHGHLWAVRYGPLVIGDLLNAHDLEKAFQTYRPVAVIHLAGSIHLRESIENPSEHYFNNVVGTLSLLRSMAKYQINSLVFSSSAAIYAPPEYLPMDEEHPKGPLNPYGRTKWIIEQLLGDFNKAHRLNAVSLRYFNAAGADPDGEIGEAHNPETHLIPRAILAAQNGKDGLTIYNSKLPTKDGTAIRDYIHVSDLAEAHVKALQWVMQKRRSDVFNLGTGRGYSVLEVVEEVEKTTGCKIPIHRENLQISESAVLIADSSKAQKGLHWKPIHSDLSTIIQTACHWHASPVLV